MIKNSNLEFSAGNWVLHLNLLLKVKLEMNMPKELEELIIE